MECFHIDESGYTGFDLLNAESAFKVPRRWSSAMKKPHD